MSVWALGRAEGLPCKRVDPRACLLPCCDLVDIVFIPPGAQENAPGVMLPKSGTVVDVVLERLRVGWRRGWPALLDVPHACSNQVRPHEHAYHPSQTVSKHMCTSSDV